MAFIEKYLSNAGADQTKLPHTLTRAAVPTCYDGCHSPCGGSGWLPHVRKGLQPLQLSDCAATPASPGDDEETT